MKYFDSHCHLDIEPLKKDYERAIERAHKGGVTGMINVGSSMRGSLASVKLSNNYPNIWAAVGLHPHEAENTIDFGFELSEIENLSGEDKVVAIGEIGLDYFDFQTSGLVSKETQSRQKILFKKQLGLANKHNLPVVFHVRDAWDDFFEIIDSKEFKAIKGVVHCFTGDDKIVEKVVKRGLYVGFTGFITFNQAKFGPIRKAVLVTPLDRILIETDAPFLAPEPFRGRVNEPLYVAQVAQKIADLKNLPVEEVAKKTYNNTRELFNLS